MKIAQVSPKYFPRIGGVESMVKEVAERLVERGHEVEVLCQERDLSAYPEKELINGVTVKRFKSYPLLTGIDLSFSMYRYMQAHSADYDLVHAHSYHSFAALYAALGKRNNKLVFTTHYHGKGKNLFTTILHIPYRTAGRIMINRADAVTCVSDYEKDLVLRHFPSVAPRLHVVNSGVDVDGIMNADPYPAEGVPLLYVGRLEQYKNIHVVIKALAFLPEEYNLTVAGTGVMKEELERLALNLGLKERVRVISGLSNQEIFRLYRTCRMVVNLSEQEAFGLSVIEGLAAGKNILVNNIMGLKEFASILKGVHPVDVASASVADIAAMIRDISEHPSETSDVNRYHWNAVTDNFEKVYRSTF